MSNAINSQGTVIAVRTALGPPAVYTPIGEVKSFNGFDGAATIIDVTSLQSTAKEKKQGLQDWGNFNLETNYLPEDIGQSALRTAKANRALVNIKLTDADLNTAVFDALVSTSPFSGGVDEVLSGSFALEITGNVVFTTVP